MKTYKYISALSLATVLLGLASCSTDEVQEMTEKTSSLELRTEIAPTRAIIEGTQFSDGDSIYLYFRGTANNVNSCAAGYRDGTWKLDREVLLNKNRAVVCGIFNWATSIQPDSKGEQTDILAGWQELSDVMAVNVDNPLAYIRFYHMLARVSFDLQQTGDKGHLTSLALTNLEKGAAIRTRLNDEYRYEIIYMANSLLAQCGLLAGQSYTPAEQTKMTADYNNVQATLRSQLFSNARSMGYIYEQEPLVMPTDMTLSEQTSTVSLLVAPTTINSSNRVGLQLTIDGKIYQVEIPAVQWDCNYHYRYPVSIDLTHDKQVSITIGTATIETWNSATILGGVEQTVPMD